MKIRVEPRISILFGKSHFPSANVAKSNQTCKTMPGDEGYPPQAIWDVFNKTLGNALVQTIPVAAPCYKSFGVYDSAKCDEITAIFTTAKLQ